MRWLSAILRVAEGLDRSHYQLVRAARSVHRRGTRFAIVVTTSRDAQLELWAGARPLDTLERLLGAEVRIVGRGRRARRLAGAQAFAASASARRRAGRPFRRASRARSSRGSRDASASERTRSPARAARFARRRTRTRSTA